MTRLSRTFGYQSVEENEREQRIRRVFEAVARRYDLMNDLMSMGIHRLWKRTLVRLAAPRAGQLIVDLAGGTGDVAARLAAADRVVAVCDPSVPMMQAGRARGHRHVQRVERAFGGAGQQRQAAAGLGLQAARQAFAQHHLQRLGAGEHAAGLHQHRWPLDGELGIGLDAHGHHHRALVAIADEAGELDPRQHLAHGVVGQQPLAQRIGVVQAPLQRLVFVARELLGLGDHQVAGGARRGLRQPLVGEQRKAAGQQDGRRAQSGDGQRDGRAPPIAQRVGPGEAQPGDQCDVHAALRSSAWASLRMAPSARRSTRSQRARRRSSCVAIRKAAPCAWPSPCLLYTSDAADE